MNSHLLLQRILARAVLLGGILAGAGVTGLHSRLWLRWPCGLAVHDASSVQIPLLGAKAAGNAAAAEQRPKKDEHHHADNDSNKLADHFSLVIKGSMLRICIK